MHICIFADYFPDKPQHQWNYWFSIIFRSWHISLSVDKLTLKTHTHKHKHMHAHTHAQGDIIAGSSTEKMHIKSTDWKRSMNVWVIPVTCAYCGELKMVRYLLLEVVNRSLKAALMMIPEDLELHWLKPLQSRSLYTLL